MPPAFEPSADARDALASAQRAHGAAELAVRDAEDNARSARAATARAELDFSAEDSNERWTLLEAARRRETSATLRAKRCADELTAATAALESANAAITAERIEHARVRASSLRLVENMRVPLARVARAMAELVRARDEIEAAEKEHFEAYRALQSVTSSGVPAPPLPLSGHELARFAAGVAAMEMGGVRSPLSDGVSIGSPQQIEISYLTQAQWRSGVRLSSEAEERLRAIALEAIK